MGLASVSNAEIAALGTVLNDDVAATLSAATDLSLPDLRAMTMSRFHGTLLVISDDTEGHTNRIVDAGWTRRSGTRFCSSCLKERPGVFDASWRLTWSYLCLRHNQLLDDNCPACHRPVREQTGRQAAPHDPSRCFVPLDALGQDRCQGFLADTPSVLRFDRTADLVLAQEATLTRVATDGPGDLMSVMSVLRSSGRLDMIAAHSRLDESDIVGLVTEEQKQGSSRPDNALAMAALATAAEAILRLSSDDADDILRELTFARPPGHVPRSAGLGPGSPDEIMSRWGHPSARLRHRILHSVDQDLTPRHRIHRLTSLTEDEMRDGRQRWGDVASRVPPLLWSSWSVPLHAEQPVNHETFRYALSNAVTGASARSHDLRSTMLGTPDQTTAIVRALSLLQVDRTTIPIDYARRAALPWEFFLTQGDWITVADAAAFNPGSDRRYRLAQRYMALRVLGGGPRDSPFGREATKSRQDAAEYTDFGLRLSRTLLVAMDNYIGAFLRTSSALPSMLGPFGTDSKAQLADEPITWSPPRRVSLDHTVIGRELQDIDIPELHALLDGGGALTVLSAHLRRPAWHIQLALEQWPGGSQVDPGVVDWSALEERLHPEPPTAMVRTYGARRRIRRP